MMSNVTEYSTPITIVHPNATITMKQSELEFHTPSSLIKNVPSQSTNLTFNSLLSDTFGYIQTPISNTVGARVYQEDYFAQNSNSKKSRRSTSNSSKILTPSVFSFSSPSSLASWIERGLKSDRISNRSGEKSLNSSSSGKLFQFSPSNLYKSEIFTSDLSTELSSILVKHKRTLKDFYENEFDEIKKNQFSEFFSSHSPEIPFISPKQMDRGLKRLIIGLSDSGNKWEQQEITSSARNLHSSQNDEDEKEDEQGSEVVQNNITTPPKRGKGKAIFFEMSEERLKDQLKENNEQIDEQTKETNFHHQTHSHSNQHHRSHSQYHNTHYNPIPSTDTNIGNHEQNHYLQSNFNLPDSSSVSQYGQQLKIQTRSHSRQHSHTRTHNSTYQTSRQSSAHRSHRSKSNRRQQHNNNHIRYDSKSAGEQSMVESTEGAWKSSDKSGDSFSKKIRGRPKGSLGRKKRTLLKKILQVKGQDYNSIDPDTIQDLLDAGIDEIKSESELLSNSFIDTENQEIKEQIKLDIEPQSPKQQTANSNSFQNIAPPEQQVEQQIGQQINQTVKQIDQSEQSKPHKKKRTRPESLLLQDSANYGIPEIMSQINNDPNGSYGIKTRISRTPSMTNRNYVYDKHLGTLLFHNQHQEASTRQSRSSSYSKYSSRRNIDNSVLQPALQLPQSLRQSRAINRTEQLYQKNNENYNQQQNGKSLNEGLMNHMKKKKKKKLVQKRKKDSEAIEANQLLTKAANQTSLITQQYKIKSALINNSNVSNNINKTISFNLKEQFPLNNQQVNSTSLFNIQNQNALHNLFHYNNNENQSQKNNGTVYSGNDFKQSNLKFNNLYQLNPSQQNQLSQQQQQKYQEQSSLHLVSRLQSFSPSLTTSQQQFQSSLTPKFSSSPFISQQQQIQMYPISQQQSSNFPLSLIPMQQQIIK